MHNTRTLVIILLYMNYIMNSILASTRSGILLARLVNNGVSLNQEQRKAFYDQFYSIGDEFHGRFSSFTTVGSFTCVFLY